MSGYRNLHREHVLRTNDEEGIPIWQVQSMTTVVRTSPPGGGDATTRCVCVWTATADGLVRAYRTQEKKDHAAEALNAAALSLTQTHALVGTTQVYPPPSQQQQQDTLTLLGCSQVSIGRNYVGDDDMAGDLVVVSLDLVGRVRVWSLDSKEFDVAVAADDDDNNDESPKQVKALYEFQVRNATGTLLALCPPRISAGQGDVVVAVACLDGSVAMVATGLATPQAKKEPSPAGTVLDRWGSGALPLSLAWHPTLHSLVVGRKDGVVDVIPSSNSKQQQGTTQHRLLHHARPVRAVAYTPDGQLLISGSDEGLVCVWDVHRKTPTLVHHVVEAHKSWILDVSALSDSRRFVTCGADHKLHVWNVGQIYAPEHTFHCDHTIWTIHATPQLQQPQRLVCGSDKGWLQIYSLDS